MSVASAARASAMQKASSRQWAPGRPSPLCMTAIGLYLETVTICDPTATNCHQAQELVTQLETARNRVAELQKVGGWI